MYFAQRHLQRQRDQTRRPNPARKSSPAVAPAAAHAQSLEKWAARMRSGVTTEGPTQPISQRILIRFGLIRIYITHGHKSDESECLEIMDTKVKNQVQCVLYYSTAPSQNKPHLQLGISPPHPPWAAQLESTKFTKPSSRIDRYTMIERGPSVYRLIRLMHPNTKNTLMIQSVALEIIKIADIHNKEPGRTMAVLCCTAPYCLEH